MKQLRQRMTEKSSRMQASLLYGHNANNMARFQNFWSMESFAPGNETSLLQWENQASLPSRIEYERWKAKMENNSAMRLNLLMRRWRRAANSIGKLVMLLVRVRDHTNQQMLFNSSAGKTARWERGYS